MYAPIKGGSKYTILDAFEEPMECWIPPFGYGRNEITGEIEKCDVIKRSSKPAEQYWEREDLPEWYEKKREAEEVMLALDPAYVDAECEKIREKHWGRRIRGCWFWNNGKSIYITGRHWFYLNWWEFQGKYLDFRITNLERFYFLQYCFEDPNCLGDIEITKRKDGKTARAGCNMYEYISRSKSKHGGIQSKGDDDSEEVFIKGIVTPFTKLPHFFVPTYDTASGDIPKKSMRFFNTSKRGIKKKTKKAPSFESWIDFGPASDDYYDGPELHWYISDECGKLKKVSILTRHNKLQMSSEVDAGFVGFHDYVTTVEDMESGGSEFLQLVKNSDRRKLNANGRTLSGLYVYFMPAYRTLYFDKYGYPDEARAKTYYMNTREGLRNDPRDLSGYIRKNPFTLQEAFRVDGDKCVFNSENLNEQLDWLSWHQDLIERGNFQWKDGERFTEIIWEKNKNGRWNMPVSFTVDNPNRVQKIQDRYVPMNNINFRMGVDPFKYDKVKNGPKKRSDCAAFIGKMFDPGNPSDPFNDSFVCRYRFRAATTAMANEDMLKMAWYFGCQALFERNVDHWKPYFIESKCEAFLMMLPGEQEYGIYSDGHSNMIQAIFDLLEDYIENNSKKLYFKETIEEYLEADPGEMTKNDETVASGICRIAMKKKTYRKAAEKGYDISNIHKIHKAS